MKKTISYAVAFVALIALFRFVTSRVDPWKYETAASPETGKTSASPRTPEEVIEASLEAYGGSERLASIREMSLKNRIKVYDKDQRTLEGRSTEYYRFPDQVRVDFEFESQRVSHLYDGLEAYTISGGKSAKAPDYLTEGLRRDVKHFPSTLLLAALDERSLLAPVESKILDGRPALSIDITDWENDFTTVWFDAGTFLMSRIDYVLYSSLGADTMTVLMSDYRPVEGIQTAFAARIYYNGERAQETAVEEVRYNPGLPDSLFVPPDRR